MKLKTYLRENRVEIDRSKAIEIFILLSSVYILCAAIHHGVFTTLQLLRALHWCWVTSARVWLNCFCKVIPTTCHRFNFYRENSDPSTLLAKISDDEWDIPQLYHEKGLHNYFIPCHRKLHVIQLNCTDWWEGSVEYWRICNIFPAIWLVVFSMAWYKAQYKTLKYVAPKLFSLFWGLWSKL